MLTADQTKDPPAHGTPMARKAEPPAGARLGGGVLAAHLVSLLGGFAVLWWVDRTQWFFGDDWDFIVDRGLSHARFGMWSPHNEHWSTLPILLYRALFSLFGVRTYAPYVLAVIAAHLILAHLLWRLMLRIGVDPWLATALAAVFAVLGAGSENLLWAFQIGFVASVLFGYIGLLLVDHPGPYGRRDIIGSLALVGGLMCSGIGVTMVAVAGASVVLRAGWSARRRALLVVAGPGAVFLVWFVLAGRKGLTGDHQQVSTLLQIPTYVWTGLANSFERTSGIPGAGPVLVVVLAGWLISRVGRAVADVAPAVALALGVILMFLIIALGRSSLGAGEALSYRYVYLTMALVLPAVGVALTELTRRRLAGRLGVIGLVGLVAVSNISLLRSDANVRLARDQPLERQILAAADLVASGQRIIATQPEPRYDPNITADSLLTLRRQGQLPTLALAPADRAAAASQLQVALSRSPLINAPFPRPVFNAASSTSQGQCATAQPNGSTANVVLATPPEGASVRLTGSADGGIGVFVTMPDGQVGPGRSFQLAAGRPMYLSVSAGDTTIIMYLPAAGTLELCGLAP